MFFTQLLFEPRVGELVAQRLGHGKRSATRLLTFLSASLGLLAGCGGPGQQLLSSDFEQFDGWQVQAPAGLSFEQAHSGHYSLKTTPGQAYSSGYLAPLGHGLPFVPRRVRVEAWVYLPDGRTREASLVLQVSPPNGENKVWERIHLENVVKRYAKWERVEKTYVLPAGLKATDPLRIYLWTPELSDIPVYLDDLRVQAWPD